MKKSVFIFCTFVTRYMYLVLYVYLCTRVRTVPDGTGDVHIHAFNILYIRPMEY